jgi:hypothetical protein
MGDRLKWRPDCRLDAVPRKMDTVTDSNAKDAQLSPFRAIPGIQSRVAIACYPFVLLRKERLACFFVGLRSRSSSAFERARI